MLSTKRLALRPPNENDVINLFSIYGDPQTNLHNPSGPHPDIDTSKVVLAGWINHWAQHGFGYWAIATSNSPEKIIGYGGLMYHQFGDLVKLNLGYRFAAESWDMGYATELGKAALEYAFFDLSQTEVFGLVRPTNSASTRVLEKLGMEHASDLDDVPGESPSLVYHTDISNKYIERKNGSD